MDKLNHLKSLCFAIVSLMLCLYSTQAQKSQAKNSSHIEVNLNGDWKIEYTSSFTEEEDGIFVESLSFKENPAKIDKIEALPKRNYESAVDESLLEAGSVQIAIRSIKNDTVIAAQGLYKLTKLGPLLHLSLFFLDDESQAEFKDGLFFELAHNTISESAPLTLKSAELRAVFHYKRNQSRKQNFPATLNNNKTLNYYNLKGRVARVETYTYNALPLRDGSYVCQKVIALDKLFFDPKGEVMKNEFRNFRWDSTSSVFEYSGDYYNNTSTKTAGPDTYPETVKTTRTALNELRFTLKQNDTLYADQTILKNGFRTHTSFQTSNKKQTMEYTYTEEGFMNSFLLFSEDQKIMDSSYYQYILFDENKNWTKRIVFADEFFQKPKNIEIRTIHYFRK